jgi:hypothetical protein
MARELGKALIPQGLAASTALRPFAAAMLSSKGSVSVWKSEVLERRPCKGEHQRDHRNKLASRHVAEGRRVVERQRALITSQRKAGLNTGASEKLLDLFESTQAIFEDDLRAAERNENSNRDNTHSKRERELD